MLSQLEVQVIHSLQFCVPGVRQRNEHSRTSNAGFELSDYSYCKIQILQTSF